MTESEKATGVINHLDELLKKEAGVWCLLYKDKPLKLTSGKSSWRRKGDAKRALTHEMYNVSELGWRDNVKQSNDLINNQIVEIVKVK